MELRLHGHSKGGPSDANGFSVWATEVRLDSRSALHGEVIEKSDKMAPYVDNAKDDVMKSAGHSSRRFESLYIYVEFQMCVPVSRRKKT